MTRKEWLENFIRLADTGASTLEYRRHCRIKAQHLPRHIAQLPSFRAELERLVAEEAEVQRHEQRLTSLEEARQARAQKRLEAIKWTSVEQAQLPGDTPVMEEDDLYESPEAPEAPE